MITVLLQPVASVFSPTYNFELRDAVKSWLDDSTIAQSKYGHISAWNTSSITSFKRLFCFYGAKHHFNEDISGWDTSKVIFMDRMFGGAGSFNQKIGVWNTSQVTDMSNMFNGCFSFNQNLGGWDTSKVKHMNGMFYNASKFNQDISRWDTTKVTDMSYMFADAFAFNQDIGIWVTASVTTMSDMFWAARTFNQNIGGWNTGKVTIMEYMFAHAPSFNKDIGSWNTARVTSMKGMFVGALAFNQNLVRWDTSNVMDLRDIFCSDFMTMSHDLSAWNQTKYKAYLIGANLLPEANKSVAWHLTCYEYPRISKSKTVKTNLRTTSTRPTTTLDDVLVKSSGYNVTSHAAARVPMCPLAFAVASIFAASVRATL